MCVLLMAMSSQTCFFSIPMAYTTFRLLASLVVVVMLVVIAEATPPGIANNPSHATCKIKKYKHCYNLEHVCPKFCPNQCYVECASCKPICGSGDTNPPPEDTPSPATPSPPSPPSETYYSPPPPVAVTPSPPASNPTPSYSPPLPSPTPVTSSPSPPITPSSPPPSSTGAPSTPPTISPPPPVTSTPPVNHPPSSPPPTNTNPPSTPPTSPAPPTISPPPPVTSTPPPVNHSPSPPPPTNTNPPSKSPTPPTISPPPPVTSTPPPVNHPASPPPPTNTNPPSTPPASPTPPTISPPPPVTSTPPLVNHPPSPPPPTNTNPPSTPPENSTPPPIYSPPSTVTSTPPPVNHSPSPSPPTNTNPPSTSPTNPNPPTPSTPNAPSPTPPSENPDSPPTNNPPPTSQTPSPPSSPSTPTPPSSSAGAAKRVRCKNVNYPQCYNMIHTCPSACPNGCEVDCVTCKPVCHCDRPGAVCQDPRFVGGDGITFYFHGKKDKDFCLVSDPNLHINGHFIGKRNPSLKRDFTWVQSLAILFHNHRLFIGAQKTNIWDDSIDRLAIALDDHPITLPTSEGSQLHHPAENPTIVIVRLAATNHVMVEAKGLFRITSKVVPITKEDSRIHNYGIEEGDAFAHLDLGFKFYGLSEDVSGVLGQTYGAEYVSGVNVKAAMAVMGRAEKFETSTLFAADCVVSRFGDGGVIDGDESI